MPNGTLTADGVDLSTRGFYHSDAPRFRGGPDRSVSAAQVLGRAGGLFVGPHVIGGRDLPVIGQVATAENTISACEAAEQALGAILYRPEIRLVFTSGVGTMRRVTGTVTDLRVTPRLNKQHFQVAQGLDATFTLRSPLGFWQDIDPTLCHMTTGGVLHNCDIGTAPSAVIVELFGGATNPAIECCDSAGRIVWRLRFLDILTSNDSIVANGSTGEITRWTNGVPSNGAGLLHADDWIWMPRLGLNPHDGNAMAGLFLRATATGAVRARAHWWKNWVSL